MSTEKVVVISVPYTDFVPAVAPALLSSCLIDAGIDSVGFDFSAQFNQEFFKKPYWNNLKLFLSGDLANTDFTYRRPVIDMLKFIKRNLLTIKKTHNPTIIGLSIFTSESINFSYILIPYIRKYMPGVKIMIGGRGLESVCQVENRPHYVKYYDHGLADIVVVGDAETEIIRAIKNNVSGIVKSVQQTKEDLDAIPSPNWDHYDFNIYDEFQNMDIQNDITRQFDNPRGQAVTASKGCVRKCSFCDVANYWPEYIFRDGGKVSADIINTYKKTGITQFVFTDNLINGSIPNYRKMNKALADAIPKTITYSGFAIFRDQQSMTAEDFELAALAGCSKWSIGVESGSETVRKDMKKNFILFWIPLN